MTEHLYGYSSQLSHLKPHKTLLTKEIQVKNLMKMYNTLQDTEGNEFSVKSYPLLLKAKSLFEQRTFGK